MGQRNARFPWATVALTLLLAQVFYLEKRSLDIGIFDLMVTNYGFNGQEFLTHPWSEFPRLFSCVLLHEGIDHFIGNLVFFVIFAPAVEAVMGSWIFLGLFVLYGALAALTQVLFIPDSAPLVGASGAISGVMGAFFVLYPLRLPAVGILRWGDTLRAWFSPWKNRKVSPVFSFGRVLLGFAMECVYWISWVLTHIPAFIYVGLWFALQIRSGLAQVLPGMEGKVSRIAHWAHVGGFCAGALSAVFFLKRMGPGDAAISDEKAAAN